MLLPSAASCNGSTHKITTLLSRPSTRLPSLSYISLACLQTTRPKSSMSTACQGNVLIAAVNSLQNKGHANLAKRSLRRTSATTTAPSAYSLHLKTARDAGPTAARIVGRLGTPRIELSNCCDNCGDMLLHSHFCKTCCSKYPTKCPQCDEQYIGTTGRERLVQKFRGGSNPEPIKASANEFQAREKKDSTEDYGDLFLCHAKLYVLGDKYLIPELKKLATHRLHATLEAFTLYPSRPRDVFGLVEYTFENVHPADEICGVLSLYCACNVESLDVNGVEELERLITEVPSFGLSLVRSMR